MNLESTPHDHEYVVVDDHVPDGTYIRITVYGPDSTVNEGVENAIVNKASHSYDGKEFLAVFDNVDDWPDAEKIRVLLARWGNSISIGPLLSDLEELVPSMKELWSQLRASQDVVNSNVLDAVFGDPKEQPGRAK